ncbi:substrate-binding domain-containing protein [Celerinatantimonas yamalensis]|uniref:Substrate-binding domain-containing protein n=1 Tax=Celerinatantimonas yamalensis TaxID=559956 RepID=A0ABW9G498_9GAMM
MSRRISTQKAGLLACLLLSTLFSPLALAKFITVAGNKADNFQNQLLSGIEQAVDGRGDESYMDVANGDFARQLEQIRQYVKTGTDAIIIVSTTRDPKQVQQIIDVSANKPLVFVNQEPLADLNKLPKHTAYVGSNEKDSGTMEMEELARLANYQGKVALLIGEPKHSAAIMRTQDVKDVIAKYPKMKLVTSEVANWNRNEAYQITKKWLSSKLDFNILVANNDEMIIGAILAMQDAGVDPKKYLTGGVDATQDALRLMAQGDLSVTVLQDAAKQGTTAVDVTYQLIQGEPTSPTYWVPFRLVTPQNYQQYLVK